ncbi:MAG: CoA-binding protein [Anaerovoracaceae bacterium]|jgi:predicted CoA-binding protein
MDLKDVMDQKNFVVVGDTLNKDKYAHKIKRKMIKNGYRVSAVGKELASINDVEGDIDVIDLCINPVRGLQLMKECKKDFKTVVIQPGAENDELTDYFKANDIPYMEGCLLVGLKQYKK